MVKLKGFISVVILLILAFVFIFGLPLRAQLFTIGFVIIVSLFQLKRNNNTDIFFPKIPLLALFYLYTLVGILIAENLGTDSLGTTIEDATKDQYVISTLIGAFGLCLGFFFASFKKDTYTKIPTKYSNNIIYKVIILYIFIALVINFSGIIEKYNFINVQSYAERAYSYRLERRESSASGLYEVFLVDSPVLFINFFSILLFFKNYNKTSLLKYLILFPFFACVFTATLSGFRSTLVTVFLPFIFLYHYQIKQLVITKSKLLLYVLAGGSVYVIINLLALLRGSSNVRDMYEFGVNYISQYGFSFLSLEKSGELSTSINLMLLIQGINDGETFFTYGKSIIDEILVFIPLYFFPGRPYSVSEQFVLTFYPHVYEAGGGLGQYCLLEGYWAFGNFGVFLTSVFFSFILVKVYYRISPYLAISPIFVILYSQIFDKMVVAVVRGGYIGAIKGAIISGIVVVFAIYLSKFLKKRENSLGT